MDWDYSIGKADGMKKGRSVIIIICLIIMLACQLQPVVSNTTEYFGSNDNENFLQLNSNPLHNSVTIPDNNSARQIFQKLSIWKMDCSISRSGSILSMRTSSVIPVQLADKRSMIWETMLTYFNGSKYKACHLKI